MYKLHITGGARIGMANATWPLASLKVDSERIVLNSGVAGNLIFKADDIVSIEEYYGILLGQGIQIKHNNPKYNDNIIFWTFKDPDEVIEKIYETGFLKNNSTIFKLKDKTVCIEGHPIKTTFAISMILFIIMLFFIDIIFYYQDFNMELHFGTGIKVALSTILLTSVLTLVSSKFRRIVLKNGRRVKEIKKYLYFLILVAGFMLLSFNLIFRF